MKRSMTPLQAGIAWGVPVGLLIAVVALISGSLRGGLISGLLDITLAFLLGAALAGGVAAFVQWRRIAGTLGDVAPPGWYDSPENDGTQWFWTGTRWTDRTRPIPPRTQTRRL